MEIVPKDTKNRARLTDFIWFFKQKKIGKQLIFLIIFYSAIISLLGILRPYMVDLGYDMKEIGFMSGIVGTIAALIFSLLSGFLIRKIKLYRARLFCAIYMVIITCFFMLCLNSHPNNIILYIAIVLLWSGYGMASTILYTTAMQFIRPGREGTDFTIQIVISHFTCMVISVISSMIADKFGYHALFNTTVFIALVVVTYCYYFGKQKIESKTI